MWLDARQSVDGSTCTCHLRAVYPMFFGGHVARRICKRIETRVNNCERVYARRWPCMRCVGPKRFARLTRSKQRVDEGRDRTAREQGNQAEQEHDEHDRCEPPLLVLTQQLPDFPPHRVPWAAGLFEKCVRRVSGVCHGVVRIDGSSAPCRGVAARRPTRCPGGSCLDVHDACAGHAH